MTHSERYKQAVIEAQIEKFVADFYEKYGNIMSKLANE